ncbi:MAG: hypothetical protein OEX12_15280, partial [Gammaproteobacteria bacterium]|nr:hypothetical protein [Gammaproteobacteria bacterium]
MLGINDTNITGMGIPRLVPGLAAWYRAADIPNVVHDNPVGEWPDISGHGHNLLQATPASQPLFKTNVKNGRPGVYFDGIDDFMQSLTLSLTQPCTYFVVFDTDDATATDIIIDGTDGINRHVITGSGVSGDLYMYAGVILYSGVPHPTSNTILLRSTFNSIDSAISVNGGAPIIGDVGTQNIPNGITVGMHNDKTS